MICYGMKYFHYGLFSTYLAYCVSATPTPSLRYMRRWQYTCIPSQLDTRQAPAPWSCIDPPADAGGPDSRVHNDTGFTQYQLCCITGTRGSAYRVRITQFPDSQVQISQVITVDSASTPEFPVAWTWDGTSYAVLSGVVWYGVVWLAG